MERLIFRAVVQLKTVVQQNRELNRKSKTEMRWNKKVVFLSSPDIIIIIIIIINLEIYSTY